MSPGRRAPGEWLVPPLRRLIPELHGRRSVEIEERSSGDAEADSRKDAEAERQLELMPYSIEAAHQHVLGLAACQREIVARVMATAPPPAYQFRQLDCDDERLLGFAVDGYLNAARRAQNATTRMMTIALRKRVGEIDKSLSDVVKKTNAGGRGGLPEPFRTLTLDYWRQSGALLKAYRDLAEHTVVVSSDARLIADEKGNGYIYLVLPNNPDADSARGVAFEPPYVHAMNYVANSFLELYGFVYDLSAALIRELGPPQRAVLSFGIKSPFPLGTAKVEGHAPLAAEQIEQAVDVLEERLREKWRL
jgi:hypothetical protein